MQKNNYPKLHNATWPGIVGKGGDSEPAIDLDTMLSLTSAAQVNGTRFDGVDLFLSLPHTSPGFTPGSLTVVEFAEKLRFSRSGARFVAPAGR